MFMLKLLHWAETATQFVIKDFLFLQETRCPISTENSCSTLMKFHTIHYKYNLIIIIISTHKSSSHTKTDHLFIMCEYLFIKHRPLTPSILFAYITRKYPNHHKGCEAERYSPGSHCVWRRWRERASKI